MNYLIVNTVHTAIMSPSKIFANLPAKIHGRVILFLDYFPLISLSQTNHYFHEFITRGRIKDALLDLERRAAREGRPLDSFKEHLLEGQFTMLSTHLPCYKCLRGLPAKLYFPPSHTTGNYALNEKSAAKRKCIGCFYRCRAKSLAESELFCAEGVLYIDCAKCNLTKRYEQSMHLNNLAWLRGKCCFDCYWAGRVTGSGEVNVVKFRTEGRERLHIEIPIAREELWGVLTTPHLSKVAEIAAEDTTG